MIALLIRTSIISFVLLCISSISGNTGFLTPPGITENRELGRDLARDFAENSAVSGKDIKLIDELIFHAKRMVLYQNGVIRRAGYDDMFNAIRDKFLILESRDEKVRVLTELIEHVESWYSDNPQANFAAKSIIYIFFEKIAARRFFTRHSPKEKAEKIVDNLSRDSMCVVLYRGISLMELRMILEFGEMVNNPKYNTFTDERYKQTYQSKNTVKARHDGREITVKLTVPAYMVDSRVEDWAIAAEMSEVMEKESAYVRRMREHIDELQRFVNENEDAFAHSREMFQRGRKLTTNEWDKFYRREEIAQFIAAQKSLKDLTIRLDEILKGEPHARIDMQYVDWEDSYNINRERFNSEKNRFKYAIGPEFEGAMAVQGLRSGDIKEINERLSISIAHDDLRNASIMRLKDASQKEVYRVSCGVQSFIVYLSLEDEDLDEAKYLETMSKASHRVVKFGKSFQALINGRSRQIVVVEDLKGPTVLDYLESLQRNGQYLIDTEREALDKEVVKAFIDVWKRSGKFITDVAIIMSQETLVPDAQGSLELRGKRYRVVIHDIGGSRPIKRGKALYYFRSVFRESSRQWGWNQTEHFDGFFDAVESALDEEEIVSFYIENLDYLQGRKFKGKDIMMTAIQRRMEEIQRKWRAVRVVYSPMLKLPRKSP